MARKYSPSISPKSKTWAMFPWLRETAMRASFTNIRTKASLSAKAGRIFLITTGLLTPAIAWKRAR